MSLCLCHCSQGHFEIVKFLVTNSKSDVNAKDENGCSPLQWACRYVYALIVHCSSVYSSVDFLQESWDEGNYCMENAHVHTITMLCLRVIPY